MSELPVLNTMWVEGPLSYVEQVCLKSALAQGHRVVLYTYFDVSGVPAGVEVRDGREVMGDDYLMKHKKRDSWALCANTFRYKLMKRERGVWIDADVYMIRPIKNTFSEYLFGWQKEDLINNAVIFFEKNGELVDSLLAFIDQQYIIPPWLPWRQRLRYQLRPMLGLRPLSLAEHRWGVIGPRALTHFAKELDLTHHAVPQDVFYPLPAKQAKLLFDPEADVDRYITDRTVAVHLWNEGIKELKRAPAPEGSFMARICAEHDVPTQ
jgi:hypothetical protein